MDVAKLRPLGRTALHAAALLATTWALVADSDPDGPGGLPAQDCFSGVGSDAGPALLQLTLGGTDSGPLPVDDAGAGDASGADVVATDSTDASVDEASAESDAEASTGETSTEADAEASTGEASTESDAQASAAEAGISGSVGALADAGAGCLGESTVQPCDSSCNGIDGIHAGGSLGLDVIYQAGPQEQPAVCNGYETTGFRGVTGVTLAAYPPYINFALTAVNGTFVWSDAPACTGAWSLTLEPNMPGIPDGGLVPVVASAGWKLVRTITFTQAQFCAPVFPVRGALQCQDTFPVTSIVSEAP